MMTIHEGPVANHQGPDQGNDDDPDVNDLQIDLTVSVTESAIDKLELRRAEICGII
jgi:hypothetical protein